MTQNKIVNLVSVIFFAENLSRPILEHHLNNIHKQIYANKEIIVVYEDARTDFDDMILRYPHCKFIPSKLGLDSCLKAQAAVEGDIVFYKTCNSIEWLPCHIDVHIEAYQKRKLNWAQSLVEFRDLAKPEDMNINDWRLTMPRPGEFEFDEISHSADTLIDWNKIFEKGFLNKVEFIKQLSMGDLTSEISVIKWINTYEQAKLQVAQQLQVPVEKTLPEKYFPTILGLSLRKNRNDDIWKEINKLDPLEINSIIIKRLVGMGDVIFTEPIRRYLKNKYPNAKIALMTSGVRGSDKIAPYLGYDEYILVPEHNITVDALMQDIKKEEIVEVDGEFVVQELITYDQTKYQIKIDLDLAYESRLVQKYIASYFEVIQVPYDSLTKEQKQYKLNYNTEYITKDEKAIYICEDNSGWQGKAWPKTHFDKMKEIFISNGYKIVEHTIKEEMSELFNSIASCKYYFGTDSGPMHIAMALGLKAIVIGGAAVAELTAAPYVEVAEAISMHIEEKDLPCLGCKHKMFFELMENNQITFVSPCRNQKGPQCMTELKPELISNFVLETLKK